jgi:large subunit ribosomal protein L5
MAHILKERYQNEISPALVKSLNLSNTMQVPRIRKVIVNVGLAKFSVHLLSANTDNWSKPIVTKARKIRTLSCGKAADRCSYPAVTCGRSWTG